MSQSKFMREVLFNDNIQLGKLKVVVQPNKSGPGIDTTRMFRQLDGTQQFFHTHQAKALPNMGRFDYNRDTRRNEAVIRYFSEREYWRTSIDASNVMTITLRKMPKKVFMEKRMEAYEEMVGIMKLLSPNYEIVV